MFAATFGAVLLMGMLTLPNYLQAGPAPELKCGATTVVKKNSCGGGRYRSAYIECYDGTKRNVRFIACTPSAQVTRVANEFCENKCNIPQQRCGVGDILDKASGQCLIDTDRDGVPDRNANNTPVDNCPNTANRDQVDWDRNGVGNACEQSFARITWNAGVVYSPWYPNEHRPGEIPENVESIWLYTQCFELIDGVSHLRLEQNTFRYPGNERMISYVLPYNDQIDYCMIDLVGVDRDGNQWEREGRVVHGVLEYTLLANNESHVGTHDLPVRGNRAWFVDLN